MTMSYRIREVEIPNRKGIFLAKYSCKHCHGTGIAGYKCEGRLIKIEGKKKPDYTIKIPISCSCLIQKEEEEKQPNDGREEQHSRLSSNIEESTTTAFPETTARRGTGQGDGRAGNDEESSPE